LSDPLYAKALLRLAAQSVGAGVLKPCDACGHAHNPICGDRVRMTLNLKDGHILRLAHETQACVLTQASASILGANLKDADLNLVEALYQDVSAMLQGGEAPKPPFEDYQALLGAVIHRNRHKCVLLPIEAVLDALAGNS
jgi:nitrogen fixation NifU-like protein